MYIDSIWISVFQSSLKVLITTLSFFIEYSSFLSKRSSKAQNICANLSSPIPETEENIKLLKKEQKKIAKKINKWIDDSCLTDFLKVEIHEI